MSELKTGKKGNWEDIEVGEIFALTGCWLICCKNTKSTYLEITDDWRDYWGGCVGECALQDYSMNYILDDIYKLPIEVQRLWKEE